MTWAGSFKLLPGELVSFTFLHSWSVMDSLRWGRKGLFDASLHSWDGSEEVTLPGASANWKLAEPYTSTVEQISLSLSPNIFSLMKWLLSLCGGSDGGLGEPSWRQGEHIMWCQAWNLTYLYLYLNEVVIEKILGQGFLLTLSAPQDF